MTPAAGGPPLKRHLHWSILAGFLLVLLAAPVAVVTWGYPKVVSRAADPKGEFVAELTIAPTDGFPESLRILWSTREAGLWGRVREAATGRIVHDERIAILRVNIDPAKVVAITWDGRGVNFSGSDAGDPFGFSVDYGRLRAK